LNTPVAPTLRLPARGRAAPRISCAVRAAARALTIIAVFRAGAAARHSAPPRSAPCRALGMRRSRRD